MYLYLAPGWSIWMSRGGKKHNIRLHCPHPLSGLRPEQLNNIEKYGDGSVKSKKYTCLPAAVCLAGDRRHGRGFAPEKNNNEPGAALPYMTEPNHLMLRQNYFHARRRKVVYG